MTVRTDSIGATSSRRLLLKALTVFSLLPAGMARAQMPGDDAWTVRFAQLEKDFDGRLGLCAIDTRDGAQFGYRMDERFPLCSTFKAVLAAAILQHSERVPGLMERLVRYEQQDLIAHSPITGRHLAGGMRVADLCAATIQYSDNAAANLLMKILGGPAAVTAFARDIGDDAFRLDRWETELNTAIPGDLRDTTTPAAMAQSLRKLVLGDALPAPQRARLAGWLRGNTTGAKRIQAGVPADWQVGDKTGTGDYGTANDVAVIWPPGRAPIVLTIYTTYAGKEAQPRDELLAAATRLAVERLSPRS
ncbi:beta-lactamase [Oxalicibacterium flavum]|uniref:Beta-lactamase n=2 Tax=Oxalicibacterium flavum TaxID=179467 RepID=A0A8J2UPS8_9BURK|nr:beta-lactamase [Oxalicibacterium flavum]